MRKVATAMVAALGTLASIATILGYLRVDPSEATGMAASMLYHAAPFVTFGGGAAFGWGVTRLLYDARSREQFAARESETASLRDERDRLLAKLDEVRRERDYARERAEIVPGLSRAASDLYTRLEDRDRLAMQRLAAASVVDHDGTPTRPLVMAVSDASLAPLGLNADGLRRLGELGAIRTHTRNGHTLVISHGDGERGPVEPGVRLDGPDALLDLPGGTLRIQLTTGSGWDGRYAGPEVNCADLGVVEYTDAGREVAAKVRTGDEAEGLREYLKGSWAAGPRYTSKPFIGCKYSAG